MKPHWPVPAGLHTASRLPVEGELPSFDGATGWLNSPPLTPEGLRGKVVLTDFWTYTCVNWLRQLPYVRAWAAKYANQGLVVIGVHTPEFSFEHDEQNVRRAVKDDNITYPVAIDNDYRVWRAFDNYYWPALYFADAHGKIRHHHYGEGEYRQSEMVIQQLLAEAGARDVGLDVVDPETPGLELAADWTDLRSPENYTGYDRTEGFSSPGGFRPDQPSVYDTPSWLGLNRWALTGNWTAGAQATTVNEAGGRITYRFQARDLNLVAGPQIPGTAVRFQLSLDGQPPGDNHGGDTDAQGQGTITEQRLYQLIRQRGPVTERTLDLTFLDPGAQTFSFTFG